LAAVATVALAPIRPAPVPAVDFANNSSVASAPAFTLISPAVISASVTVAFTVVVDLVSATAAPSDATPPILTPSASALASVSAVALTLTRPSSPASTLLPLPIFASTCDAWRAVATTPEPEYKPPADACPQADTPPDDSACNSSWPAVISLFFTTPEDTVPDLFDTTTTPPTASAPACSP